jgi:dTDP-4-amino-4,6-dideoxygalactose transaminase
MLTTPDDGADARFRTLRQHGMSIPDTVRHRSPQVLFEHYSHAGFNYRMTDLQAALGRVQLSRLPGLVAQRRALVGRYKELLSDIPKLQLPAEPAWARSNWQSYCVRLPSGVDQKQVMQRLLDDQIASRRGIMCCHLEPAYQSIPWVAGAGGLHHSEAAQRECILLPLFQGMSEAEQDRVAASLRGALGCGDRK